MDVIEKFLNEVSWKFDKGYPDITNEQDILMLDRMMEEYGIDLNEGDAEEGIEILKKELGFSDDNFLRKSGTTYKLLVPRPERTEYAKRIDDLEGFEYDGSLPGSSMGGIRYKGAKFLIKPTGAQGRAASGLGNEDVLVNEVRKYLEEGAKNVIFEGSNKTYITKNITEIKDVGYDVAGGKKADVVLVGAENYPISIKKLNAGFWESADTRYKTVINKLRDKISDDELLPLGLTPYLDINGNPKEGIYTMYNQDTNKKVAGVIVTDLPDSEEESIIFGSDNAVVVYATYTPNDFKLEGENLIIKVGKILEDMGDVEEFNLQPVLNIRHDSTRKSTKGLRSIVQPFSLTYKEGKLKGSNIEISFNDIMS